MRTRTPTLDLDGKTRHIGTVRLRDRIKVTQHLDPTVLLCNLSKMRRPDVTVVARSREIGHDVRWIGEPFRPKMAYLGRMASEFVFVESGSPG